jgi:PBP1b-binding outer membrane lipoprotein LpoB
MYKVLGTIAVLAILISGCAKSQPKNSKTSENNVDRLGSDFTKFAMDISNPKLCQQACDIYDRCVAPMLNLTLHKDLKLCVG